MGRIKTALIKRVTRELMNTQGGRFTNNFEENKKIVNKIVSTPSKKLKNIIAGYITRLVKENEKKRLI